MVKKSEKNEAENAEKVEAQEAKSSTLNEKKKVKLSQTDYEKKILELADGGLTSEKIGESLKKQGIHPKDYDNKISKILGEKYVNPDLKNVEVKLERIKKHFETNKQDKRAMREKDRVFAQLRKLKKYFKV